MRILFFIEIFFAFDNLILCEESRNDFSIFFRFFSLFSFIEIIENFETEIFLCEFFFFVEIFFAFDNLILYEGSRNDFSIFFRSFFFSLIEIMKNLETEIFLLKI